MGTWEGPRPDWGVQGRLRADQPMQHGGQSEKGLARKPRPVRDSHVCKALGEEE